MNSLSMSAVVIGTPEIGQKRDGTKKVSFEVSSDGGEAPLYFPCLAYGYLGDRAGQLREGDKVFLDGRLLASKYGAPQVYVLNGFELLARNGEVHE